MALHVFVCVFLLVVCFPLSLVLLWRRDWFPLRSASTKGSTKRSRLPRLLKPRTPHDCPACRLASPASSSAGQAPAPVRPWSEVKSRRGARHSHPHRRLRLSEPAVSVLPEYRCSVPRPRRGRQAWLCRADSDLSMSGVPHHLRLQAQHASLPPDPPLTAGRYGALGAGRRTGPFRCRAGLRLSTSDHRYLAYSRWATRTDLARTLLWPSLDPPPPTGRTAHQAAESSAGVMVMAGY